MIIERSKDSFYSNQNISLLEHSQASCSFSQLPIEVQETLQKASNSKLTLAPNKKAFVVDPSYEISHLSNKSLVSLHEIFSSYLKKKEEAQFSIHLFDVEDLIFRRATQDPNAFQQFKQLIQKDSPLLKKINDLVNTGSRFYRLEPVSNETKLQIAENETKYPVNSDKPLKVLKVTLENSRNVSGGIATVVMGLAAAHKQLRALNPMCSKAYSISPLYEKDKIIARNFKYQGIVSHFYKGKIVHSSIYKNKDSFEYLVQPDPSFSRLFNTPTIMASSSEGTFERQLYLGSAAAAFANFYKGKTGDRHIQILQCEGLNALIFASCSLVNSLYEPIRKAHGLEEKTHPIAVWHHGNIGWSPPLGIKESELLRINSGEKYDFNKDPLEVGLLHAEKVVYVSQELASRAVHPDPEINRGRRYCLLGPNKVLSILNGVEVEKFDPTETKTFKGLFLEKTFNSRGEETTNYMAYRKKLKKLLFEAGILKNPDLPLAVFVGRYCKEKGIETLGDVVQNFSSHVQFACMGQGVTQGLDRLKDMEKNSNQDNLTLLTTLEEQNKKFSHGGIDYNVPIGLLIRAAADFCLIPSHIEACGLVAMEGQCSGGVIIAPFHQGLKELCQPEGYVPAHSNKPYTLDKDANSICYNNPKDSNDAIHALTKALSIWESKTDEERNDIARRIRNDAVSSYDWYHIDTSKKIVKGGAVSYDKLYHEMLGKTAPSSVYIEGEEVPFSFQSSFVSTPVPSESRSFSFGIGIINSLARIFHRGLSFFYDLI